MKSGFPDSFRMKPVLLACMACLSTGFPAFSIVEAGTLSVDTAAGKPASVVTVPASAPSLPADIWRDNARVRQVLEPTRDFSKAEPFEVMQGGAGTQTTNTDRNAYSQETSTLDFEHLQTFKLGNALFNKLWVASPSSTQASDGLGPFFNARACQSCHIKDGRGQLPVAGEKTASLLIQLKNHLDGRWGPDPVYGGQFHASAVPGVRAEGQVRISTEPLIREFSDGTRHVLQKPVYTLLDLAYGEMHPGTRLSPRIAPAMPGLGMLEAIAADDILAYADPDDADGDGISGRPNWQVLDNGQRVLGRFAHKAAMSTVREQNVHAMFSDMGLSSSGASMSNPQGDCMPAQEVCKSLAHGEQARLGKGEAPDDVVDLITFYTRNLALPARRNVDDPEVLMGKQLFYDSGCQACHVPKHVTARDAPQKEMQFQLIWPYTDLLLHDMGEDLADHADEADANGREWRTAPLWGIGLAKTVNPNTSFLHDGRAKTLLDAVLWHGGEAQASLDDVLDMNKDERAALVTFLESL
ncbi:di-heme oxidoreductase family protein [Granulosicoccus sp. 3-233]|uniref:di-heme oxidoreductase family protein n=1 Tax=Granulosicoccus sp. 3-233 TaxID=3417969 RepID=UPI003D33F484